MNLTGMRSMMGLAAAAALLSVGVAQAERAVKERPEPKPMTDAEYAAAVNRIEQQARAREQAEKAWARRHRKREGTSLLDKARRARSRI